MLALTEHRRGAYRESNAHCRSYIEKYPSGELASSVAFLEAENDFLFGDYESAVERYRALAHGAGDDPQTRKARYRLGLALHRLGRFEEAAEALEPIAVSAPTDATFHPALLALGDCAFQRGEWKKAEQYMEAYLSAEGVPSADDALLKLGLAQARQGRYKDALPCFDRLLRDVPDSSHRLQTMFERGQALVALDDPDGAAEAFERVVSEGADSQFVPYALNHLGAIALRRQQFDKAAEILGRVTADAPTSADALFQRGQALFAAQDFESAERVFTEFASGNPADAERLAEARARAAICVARQDRCQEAVGAIDQLQRDHWSSLAAPLRDSVLYEKAWCLRQLGDADAAGDIYRLLVNDATQAGIRAHAAVELAAIEFAGRRYEAAAKLLRAALDGAEGASASLTADLEEQTLYRLAVCDFELSEYDAAADLLEKLIEKYPKSGLLPSALSFCGDALLRLDQAERAAKHLTRVVEEFPSDPACAPSLLRLGEAYAALHRWAQSERAFDDYLSRYPGAEHWFQAQFGVGWARENQQRYAEAIRAYEKVVAGHQGPTAGRAQFQIGECLYALKRHEEAIRELLKVDILYAYPEWSAAALYEAGRCFEELGKGVEARQQYEQVAQKHGETRWAEMAAKRLATVADASIPGR